MGILDTLGEFGLDPRELAKRLDPRLLARDVVTGVKDLRPGGPAWQTPPAGQQQSAPVGPMSQPGKMAAPAAPVAQDSAQPGKVATTDPNGNPITADRDPNTGLVRRGAASAAQPKPPQPGTAPTATAPPIGPAGKALQDWEAANPPPTIEPLHGFKKVLDTVGKVIDPAAEAAIRGEPEKRWAGQLANLEGAAKAEQGITTGQATLGKTLAEANEANVRAAAEAATLGRPKLLTGDQDTATVNGARYSRYENPDGTTQWVKEGDTPQVSAAPGGNSPNPPGKIANPPAAPQPAAGQLPAGATIGRTPNPTPEEAAKLAPVGPRSDTYTRQIADLPGIKPADFPVAPTDSQEQAEKTLANARSQSEAMARKQSEERGAASEARANQNEDMKPVQATDPATGKPVITNLGDARKRGLQDVVQVDAKAMETARATVTNVNLMEQALKNLKENISDIDSLSAADKRDVNTILNSRELIPEGGALGYVSGSLGQMLNSALSQAEYSKMTDPAKNILRSIITLRESSLGLGKLETGGSRAMQAAIDAINATIPGRPLLTSKDAEQQLRQFADRLDEIKSEAPVMKGESFRENPYAAPKPGPVGGLKPAKFVNGQYVDATTGKPIPAAAGK
jgi:hypothetical protein